MNAGDSNLISVVIPHLNRAELLAETLASVRAQTLPNWEAIVVDNGSEASQWQAALNLADERTRVVAREGEPRGPSRCRNLGLDLARGTHVIFLDSDDLMAPWCLAQRSELVLKTPQASFWVFPVLLFQERMGDSETCWNDLDTGSDLSRFLAADPPWHTSSPIWSRSALTRLGGFNEAVMYGDDTDLHVRALLQNLPYAKIGDAVPDVFIRRGSSSRITNTVSEDLLASRRVRLREGSTALSGQGNELLAAWEGQYFVEAEFLLFNTPRPAGAVRQVLSDWTRRHTPSRWRRLVARSYLEVALATRDRAYILLRIARRVAMALLPGAFFATSRSFQNTTIPKGVADELRTRLGSGTLVT